MIRKVEILMNKRYTVSNGKVVLTLETAEEGGYVVTSPLDPGLITQAETIEDAFANARDAAQALKQARVKLPRRRKWNDRSLCGRNDYPRPRVLNNGEINF